MQVGEGIFAVDDATVVGALAVVVDKFGRQGRAAENNRDGDALLVEGGQIVFHEGGRFDQQAAHGNAVGPVLAVGLDDRVYGLFDAQVDHLVAVVRQNDIHQVFADVVDIALDRGDDEGALARAVAVGFLHVGLQVGDGGFHGLGRLQHKGQLHLPRAKQFAHHLHAVEQKGVDDFQRWVGF